MRFSFLCFRLRRYTFQVSQVLFALFGSREPSPFGVLPNESLFDLTYSRDPFAILVFCFHSRRYTSQVFQVLFPLFGSRKLSPFGVLPNESLFDLTYSRDFFAILVLCFH